MCDHLVFLQLQTLREVKCNWNWSGITGLKSIPIADRLRLLRNLTRKITNYSAFRKEIQKVVKACQSFDCVLTALTLYATNSRYKDSPIAKAYCDAGYSNRKKAFFTAEDFYVSL